MTGQSRGESAFLTEARRIVDDAWEELRLRPFVQRKLGVTLTKLPDVSLVEARRRSNVGSSLLKRLDSLDHTEFPHDLMLSLRLVRFRANVWSQEAEWYWNVVDPLGSGMFGLFLPTAYCGGWLLTRINSYLASFPFLEFSDADRYLALVADYARLIDQFTARTVGQAERDIRMPKVQIHQARTLLARFRTGLPQAIRVTHQRLAALPGKNIDREIADLIASCVEPAFDRALGALSETYLAQAPDTVGLGQYKGGAQVYAELVRLHTTLNITPEEVHACGHARMAGIEREKGAIQTELGFKGDHAGFLAHLNQDLRWRASTVAGVTALFQRYIDRLKPRFHEYFSVAPKAGYGVAPLPETLQESMTFGYFESPGKGNAEGRYLFNPGNLTKQPLFTLGSLTYHELVPGHHLQVATQQENDELHPFRQYNSVTSYAEGWAEYAATLAGEIGLYEQPEERYGRLVFDAFFTSRLVVDTGMNALGWSLERGRDYMRRHGGMSEAEILTDSVRYSCDIPGQALAYKIGDTEMLALRDRMRRALGARFDLKDFHTAILAPGALPLSDLQWHVEFVTERLRTRG
jgi:uncharacterized protein (DUF885 family)